MVEGLPSTAGPEGAGYRSALHGIDDVLGPAARPQPARHRIPPSLTHDRLDARQSGDPNLSLDICQEVSNGTGPLDRTRPMRRTKPTPTSPAQSAPADGSRLHVDDLYYGEVAIHYLIGAPLLLPVSYAEASDLITQFERGNTYLLVRSADNRTVLLRNDAIADIYVSSEAYDTYGPAGISYEHIGPIDFSFAFWQVMGADDLDFEGRIEEAQVQAAYRALENYVLEYEDEQDLPELIRSRAQDVVWRYSGGQARSETLVHRLGKDDVDAVDGIIAWVRVVAGGGDGQKRSRFTWDHCPGHRQMAIHLAQIDYLCAPDHIVFGRH